MQPKEGFCLKVTKGPTWGPEALKPLQISEGLTRGANLLVFPQHNHIEKIPTAQVKKRPPRDKRSTTYLFNKRPIAYKEMTSALSYG
jgi:hypothetical protein